MANYEGYDPVFSNYKKSVSWGVVYRNPLISFIVEKRSKTALFLLLSGTKFRLAFPKNDQNQTS